MRVNRIARCMIYDVYVPFSSMLENSMFRSYSLGPFMIQSSPVFNLFVDHMEIYSICGSSQFLGKTIMDHDPIFIKSKKYKKRIMIQIVFPRVHKKGILPSVIVIFDPQLESRSC